MNAVEKFVEARAGLVNLVSLESGVKVLRLGSPEERKVVLSPERLASLSEAIDELTENPPCGLIIAGSGTEMFTVGVDIALISQIRSGDEAADLARTGQAVFSKLERLPCPTVAAISGPCVGGGCELVLACDYRVMTGAPCSKIGLPEIKIGILPGFGGTQRLPNLIGLISAIRFILAGRVVNARTAKRLGLVDEVVSNDELLAVAERLALSQKRGSTRLARIRNFLERNRLIRGLVFRRAEAALAAQNEVFLAPPAALRAIRAGIEEGKAQGYKREAAELGNLAATPQSKGLVHLFTAIQAAKRLGRLALVGSQQPHVVVLGGDAKGVSLACLCARQGCTVALLDPNQAAIDGAEGHARQLLGKVRSYSENERNMILSRISYCSKDHPALANAAFVLDAIPLSSEKKGQLLRELKPFLPHDAVVALNDLDPYVVDAFSDRAGILGGNFLHPLEDSKAVELVMRAETSDRTLLAASSLCRMLERYPVVLRHEPGLLINRLTAAYLLEAGELLIEGNTIEAVDAAAENFGMEKGPFRLADEIGLERVKLIIESVAEIFELPNGGRRCYELLLENNRRGKECGAGFYLYKGRGRNGRADAHLYDLLNIAKHNPAPVEDDVVTERLVLAMVSAAVRSHDDGLAGSPGTEASMQIDLASVMALGFPAFRGGLIYYSSSIGPKILAARIKQLQSQGKLRFIPAAGIDVRNAHSRAFHQSMK